MNRIRRRITIAPAAAVAFAMALAACGGGVKNSNATSSAQTAATPPAVSGQTTTQTGTSTQATTSTAGGSSSAGATAPLAQETVKAPASRDGTVDIAVVGLSVQGQLATLSVRFTPHFPSKAPDDSIDLYDMSDGALDTGSVSLLDPVGLKRYLVVKDANGDSLGASQVGTEAVNDSSVIAHWTFAAPPPDLAKIDVELGPFPAINDVPISR